MSALQIISLILRVLLTLAFAGAIVAKLTGQEMATQMFELIGLGPWLLYLTVLIYVVAIVLLWLPGRAALGACLLGGTMVFAVLSHVVYGGSAVPAIVLGLMSAGVLYIHRDQALKFIGR